MATKRPLVNYSGTIKELQVGDDITGATGGDVVGPASATDNAVARYNLTTGKLIQNSGVIIDDSNNVSGVVTLTTTNLIVNDDTTLGGSNADSVTVNGRITTDLEPATNNAKDIGTNGRNWRDGFFGRNLNTVNLAVTGTTSFDGNQGSSGQVLTSAGSGNTPTWETPTSGGDVFKASTNTFTANQIIETTNNSSAALRVTQLGTGDAIRVEDESNPDSSPFVVKADGKVGIGTSSPDNALDVVATEPFVKISTASSGLSAFYQATTPIGSLYLGKDRDGSSGLFGSGGQYVIAGTGNYPMDFWTNTVKRMSITSAGGVSFGSSGTAYGTTGQVLTSNGNAPPTWSDPTGGGGAVADGCIYENNLTITSNYTLTTNKNGFSVGPITIASGAVVTVPSGQRWVVL
jgi:hypothetical protein